MTVDNGKVVVVVLLAYEAAGILAECPHLVFERSRISDELRFVENIVDLFDNLVPDLDTNADVNRSGQVGDIVLTADFFKPLCASASGCDYRMVGVYLHFNAFVVGNINALALFTVENNV